MTDNTHARFASPGSTADGNQLFLPHTALSRAIRTHSYPVVPKALARLLDAEDQLDAAHSANATPAPGLAGFLARTAAELAAGQKLPDDLGTAAQAALDEEERQRTTTQALHRLSAALERHWAEAVRDGADEMLAGLQTQLTETLLPKIRESASALAGLDLADPEAVLDANAEQTAAAGQLKALRPQYIQLRGMQTAVVESALEEPPRRNGFDAESRTWQRNVWPTRIHEFRDAAQAPVSVAPSKFLWYVPLFDRQDVWLPSLADLTTAWAAIRDKSLTPTSPASVSDRNPFEMLPEQRAAAEHNMRTLPLLAANKGR